MNAPEPYTLARPDGVVLHGLCWRPVDVDPRVSRHVVFVHGLGEHIGRYAGLGEWFARRGWTMRGHDHRGHGLSPGRRGSVPSPQDLLDDLDAAIDALPADAPSAPLLMGQSFGGLIAATYALRQPQRVAGLVLSSPALAATPTALQRLLLAVMTPLAPDFPVHNGLDPSKLSHDAAVVRAYVDDPLVHDRISARLGRFIIDTASDALARAPTLSVPTLLLYAGDDRMVDPAGSREFARRAPGALLAAREYPELWHDLLHESSAGLDAVLADLGAWLARVHATLVNP